MGLLREYSEIDKYGSPPNTYFPMKRYYDPGFEGLQCPFEEQLEIVTKLVPHVNELNPDADVSNTFYSYRNFVPNLINLVVSLVSTLDERARGEHVARLLDTFKNHTYEYKFIADTFKCHNEDL